MTSWRAVDYIGTTWTVRRGSTSVGAFAVTGVRWGAFVGEFRPTAEYATLRPLVAVANALDDLAADDAVAVEASDAVWGVLQRHVTVTGPGGERMVGPVLWFGIEGADIDGVRFEELEFPESVTSPSSDPSPE